MTNPKCQQCGLVNFSRVEECRRCGAGLIIDDASGTQTLSEENAFEDESGAQAPRSLVKRVGVGVGVAAFLLLLCYISLLESSAPGSYEQKVLVGRAISLIEQSGFEGDAFLLRRLANYRTTDSWWNRWLGHGDAYAATNFPFQVVTLYPDFFKHATDDTERAVILLHEARHLAGAGEAKAFAGVWRDKVRLGWTKEKYGQTRVWKNVKEFTLKYAPEVFQCGADGQSDCVEFSSNAR